MWLLSMNAVSITLTDVGGSAKSGWYPNIFLKAVVVYQNQTIPYKTTFRVAHVKL